MYKVMIPPFEFTKATITASKIHPTTSLITPADKAIVPTGVCVSLYSTSIRQRTGKAVICGDNK